MTSVEKRRSGRKSGGHRRHSDGGYSDTSSGGSFLDENDREVSSLTDRAFRSLCIGDEAVYNDSDLSLSSPCIQKDRQLAFSQSGQERDREHREREELKRAAHENFSLKVQQYGQDWIHGRRYGGEIHRDPRWEVYGERAQGRISATFQHSVVETSEQEKSLREELNFLSNGATELSSQQRRSRSRVSSLIRAFNSEGHRDGVGMDDKLREWSDETSWDKSALMSIQRELSEFSTSYQQSFHSGHFPSSGPFSYRDANLCSSGSDIAAASHSSFMRSSHNKQSMFTQVNCNSSVFIHSEFSPFKVWRDHNRFPFQQGQVSSFMHCSEFPKWYETPMYKEPSQMGQPQGYYTGIRQPRSNLAPMISPALPRSTSASTMLHNASAVEKRCESELAGHYPHRKRAQSLGTNRVPTHRPSTASPTSEMSRRVRDTISSVKALQQKIKMMTEQNITTGLIENQQAVLYSNENLSLGNNAVTAMPNTVSSNTSVTPFNGPLVHAHPEAVSSDFQHYAVSPQPMEHPPVRAESRGATPDIRMSTYKSRATSLLFNLKDNRKRVKSTYSPTKFKAAETPEKNKQAPIQEPRETVIEIPYFPDSEIQFSQLEESSRTSAAINQYHSPELSLTMSNSQPVMATTTTGQYTAYSLSDYQTAQMQGQMVHHSGFTGFLPENYTGNKLANGQNIHEDLASFAPYKQDTMADAGTLGRDLYTHNPLYSATEAPRLNADNNQSGEYLISKPNTEQPFNETVGRLFTKVEKCEQLKHTKHDYNNVSLQDKRRQINSQDTEKLGMKATLSPWKQETAALMEKTRQENQQNIDQELEKAEMRKSFVFHPSDKKPSLVNTSISNQPLSNDTVENHRPLAVKDKNVLQKDVGSNEETEMKDTHFKQNYNKHNDNEYISNQTFSSIKDKHIDSGGHILQPTEAKSQSEHNIHKNSFNPDNTSAPQMTEQMKDRQFVEVKAEPVMAEHIKSHHTQAEVAKVQQWAQVEQPEAESSRLILAGQNDSEKVATEQAQAQAAHIKGEKIKGEQTRQFREKQPELAREEQTKAEQTRIHVARDEPRNITEEAGAEHIKKEQGKQVKAEQAEAEKLKEEHIKTELAKTEQAWQARIEEAKTEQATEKRINAAQIQEVQVTTEQVKKEQTEAKQSGTEKVTAKQAGAEKTNTEQAKEQQTEEKQVRTKAAEVEKVQTGHIKTENFQKVKKGKASAHVGRVNTAWSTAEISTMQDAKPKERKVEWSKQERAKAELIKAESMQELSAKLTAKLTATQQVKIEPDKVEQVKTELAKAKAELAKIKEKMRGEQKEKVKHSAITKEDNTPKNNVPLKLNIDKHEDYLKQDKTVQMHQQKENSVTRNASGQTDRGADDYERLREKYGFTNLILANRNNAPVTENISLNDANETQVLSPDKIGKVNKEKSTEEHSPTSRFTTANKEKMEEVGGFKSSEVSESQCVYSDSSKEFKLSSVTYAPTNVNKRMNSNSVTDKVKDSSFGKLEKCDPVKVAEVSQQRDSDLVKLVPHERKPKPESNKDQQFIPLRSLSHKERTMTKQEILTSKIKAHAEKEISAIKEKGCAIPDGFISKGTSKQLAGSQTVNVRQRPPSQEVSKKHESSVPSNIKPKPQMEPSGVQVDPVKSLSPTSSAAIPVKSAATTTHNIMSTAECSLQNQKQEAKPMKNKEQPPMNDQGKQKADHAEISGKPKDGLKDYSAIDTDNLNKKEDVSAHTAGVEATSPKPETTGNVESKEAARVDLSPLLNVVFGQKKDPAADQNLQIKGIMVTVRERKPTVTACQGNCSDQHQVNATEKESNSSDLDKHPPNAGLELSERNISANYIQETENQAKYIIKSNSENVQETPPSEAVKNNMGMCKKRTQSQQESSTINIKPQGETPPETLTEKGAHFTVTVSAKNKVLGETQPLLYKEDIIAIERKDHTDKTPRENPASSLRTDEEKTAQKVLTAHTNENFTVTAVDAGVSNTNDAGTLIKQVAQQTVKEDMTNVVNQSNISSVDGFRTPRLEENKHDSTTAKTLNTSPSNEATKNERTHLSHKLKNDNEKLIRDANKKNDDVHIDSIAIRVVPPLTQDSLEKVGKQHGATLSYDVVQSNEEKQVASSSCKEKVKTLNTEEEASTKKYSSEDTLGVQRVLSSVRKLSDSLKISNQQKSNSATRENMQSGNEELEKIKKSGESVGQSNEQPAEGEYFQVQGITETSNEPQYNSITDRDASKRGELPGLPPNKTAVSNESHKEGKTEAFVFTLDQSKRKTADSSTLRIQAEDTKRKAEAEDKLASKQGDGSRERWRSNENTEADQDNHIRKQVEKQSTSSATERQRSRNSRPAKESTVQEKPEVKLKPKGKVSTIPEISAIADYARLKVIVSEDREENTFQEYPPNKKEGFFPLIHTRHSRRPVFTPDPQECSVKEKSLPNKTEMSAKVNKVPKVLVFPITDKEHQRTGMFKLGEKEKQDAKVNEDPADNATKYTHHKERNDSPKTQTVQMSDSQRVCQEHQSICQPNSHSLEAATSASVAKNFLLYPTTGQTHNRKENLTQQMQDERVEKQQDKDTESNTENGRTDKLKEERPTTQHDEIKVKQQCRKKQGGEEQALRCEEEKKGDMRKKHILEESRASLAEEERRATQREEERRARERDAIAIKIKERRDKQRESERTADEERKVKQKEEDIRAKQREEKMRMKETEEKTKINIEEQHRAAQEELQRKVAQEEQQKRAAQEEQQRRAAHEELKRKAAQEEQQKRAAQEEQQRRAAQEEQQKRAAQEELQRRAAHEELKRKAAQEEQQKRVAQEEQERRAAQEEQQRQAAQEEQQRRAQEELQRKAAQEEQQKRVAQEEQERRAAQEEQQRRAAQEEQQRRAAQEEQQRRAQEELQRKAAQEEQQKRVAQEEQERRAAQEEQQRRAAQEEQQRRAQEELQRKAAQEEQQKRVAKEEQERRAAQEEQQRQAAQEEQQRAVWEEQQKRAAQEELQRKAAQEQERRTAQEELQRRSAKEELQRRAAQEEQQKRVAQEDQERRAAQAELQRRAAKEEQQRRAAQEEQRRRAAQEELQRRAAQEQERRTTQEEQERRAAQEEQQRRAAQEEQQRAVWEEQQKRVAQEEQQKRVAKEEQERRAARKELQRRAPKEELQRRAVQEEQQKRAEQEEQQKRAVQEEQQRRVAQEELQRRAAQEMQQRATQEHQRRAAQEEQQRAVWEEQQKRVAQEEQQRRAVQEEQQKRVAQEEQQKRVAQEEQQRRAVQEEQQKRAAQEEQQKRAVQEEQQRRVAQEEHQRRAAQEELQRRAAEEEQQRRAAEEEQQRRATQEEQQKKVVQKEQQRVAQEEEHRKAEEQQRRAAQREVQRRAVQEIQQRRRAALIEEQREIEEKILNNTEKEKNRKHREEDKVTHISEKERINQIQIEEQKRQRWKNEEWITQKGEAEKRAVENEKIIKEQKQVKERPKLLENSQEALKEEKKVAKERMLAQRDDDIQANERKEQLPADTENVRDAQVEQKRAAQVDALQYYAITSTESEKKPRERQLCSPSPSQQRNNLSEHESPESHMRPSRPHAPASPASSLPRSNTSSPALGAKPLMFRVKDNTFRGSSSTKSVKPRFFKSFGDDYRVGSPSDRGSDKREEEQEKIRHSSGTPVHPDTGLNRLTQSVSSPQDHSTPIPHYRPYSRRSIAMDEDDTRSLISNLSEDVESFATSAADLAETRGLYDYERPESACSFSSDASRSLGKPPVVPPKSEKALRRAQRLTTRRMKKESSKVATDSPAGIEKDVSTIRSPSSTEVRSPNQHAMASPHFSSPISLANAPVSGSSLPSSHTEHQSSHYSFHASPHTTGPISIPHSTAAVSLPAASPYATGPASHAAAPKTVAHVPSSPTLHHANHTAPVTQYHVESSYPQSYPLTQRKVLQDPGSGQYFVVDLPVQVKKKTFFDPQTGKYIQLNVRESGQSILQSQPQQTCPQPQLQPQMQIKPQQQPFPQTFPAGKPFLLYQGYHSYPQGYQPAGINSLHPNRSQVPAVVHQNQQPEYPAFELGQNSEGHRYSPEKTPYMDTVNDKDKTRNTVYSTHGSYQSFPECDTNSQLAGSSVCENDNSAHSQCHPRDIIAMSELEDFMEVSDW